MKTFEKIFPGLRFALFNVARGVAPFSIVGAGLASFFVFSAALPPKITPIDLAAEPLYAAGGGGRAKPTLTLALSVEFPTVGAQYLDNYDQKKQYLGYFDSESCYRYENSNNQNLRRFDRFGPAVARGCGGAGFSGNFMNWASSSAIDILRLGLTGGDRVVDNSTTTILQRAVLSAGRFYNDGNFPSKVLPPNLAANAVPANLRGSYSGNIYIANCLNRVHFGTEATGSCNAPGANSNLGTSAGFISNPSRGTSVITSDNFFYVRVRVCEVESSGEPLYPKAGYCQRFPNGGFKPVGNMQKYSDRMRVAAFGYIADDVQARYGGVLRAPMKYVGAKQYDENGAALSTTNPTAEWDEFTGIFVANPLSASEGRSGVINYLNQFGRVGGTFGYYKTFDPIGELYYESLRYIQGLPPTPQATEGITTAMKDGYPVYTTWVDPHADGDPNRNYSCLKNSIVMIGDKNTHNDKSIPGNTSRLSNSEFSRVASIGANEPNFVEWTKVVGGFEANVSRSYIDGKGILRTTENPNGNNQPYAVRGDLANIDTANTGATLASYYSAGMAYWANTHDIRGKDWSNIEKRRPGMRAKTYVLDVNEFGGSTDANARRNNQLFLTAKYGGFTDLSEKGNPYRDSANAVDNTGWSKEGAEAGEAKTYFLASDASSVLAAIDDIFKSIAADANTIAGGAVSTSSLTTAASGFTYQARFDPADWSGDVLSLAVSTDNAGDIQIADASTAQWSASAQLTKKLFSDRRIFIGKAVPNLSSAADNFVWEDVETSVQVALSKATVAAPVDLLGEKRLNFLRGDRSLEGKTFRRRGGLIGDIVNSAIVYSGVPTAEFNTPDYKKFYANNKGRAAALFVGANDGMLHAFDANTGNELFGFIPSWMTPKLSALTNTGYNTSLHQSYVDGLITVKEALVGPSNTSKDWRTVLVAGTGGGGQGVFALDVTNPSAFDKSKVMWEFTDRNDVDLGNVIGKPQIMRFKTGSTGAGAFKKSVYSNFAVFAGGVNNYVNDGYFSSTGRAHLFLLDLSKKNGNPWILGTNYFKIELPHDIKLLDAITKETRAVGAVNFNATAGQDGSVEALYVGDLHGRMWKLNFSAAGGGTVDWTPSKLSAYTEGVGNAPKPFFIARDESGVPQPITAEPFLSAGTNGATVVLFGTGKYLESSDNAISAATQVQSVYALWDPEIAFKADTGPAAIAGRDRLQKGTVVSNTNKVTIPDFTWGHATSDGDPSQRSGWYFDFSSSGERQISSFASFGINAVFASVVPPTAASKDACGGGSGAAYIVNIATGDGDRLASSVGVLSAPLIFQTGNPEVSGRDSAGQRMSTIKGRVVIQGSGGLESVKQLTDTAPVGRLSWRQISNYQEMKAAP